MLYKYIKAITSSNIDVSLLRDTKEQIDQLNELDILIDIDNIDNAKAILVSLGWIFYKQSRTLSHKYVAVKLIDGRIYTLDIHTALIQSGFIYITNYWFFSHSITVEPQLFQPNNVAYLYHIIFHVILGKSTLHGKYIATLNQLSITEADKCELLVAARRYGVEDVMSRVLEDVVSVLSNENEVARLKSRAKLALSSRDPSVIVRKIVPLLHRIFGPIFGRSRGLTIAFMGPDGAGKSTFIDELANKFEKCGLSTRNAYMGPWDRNQFFTSLGLEYLGSSPHDEIIGLKDLPPGIRRRVKWAKGIMRRYLYYINTPIEFYYRYFRYVLPHSYRGRVVLMDRYIHDLELGYKNHPVENNKLLRRLLVRISPAPDIMILLYNDPKTIWSRKREDKLEEIEWAMESYTKMADSYGFKKVKTARACTILVDEFMNEYWRCIYAKKSDKHEHSMERCSY